MCSMHVCLNMCTILTQVQCMVYYRDLVLKLPISILQTCALEHAGMLASVKYLCECEGQLVYHTGTCARFNIKRLCERGSTRSLIKNRQHEEAIWCCRTREDRLSVLWPNKCFHSIKAIRLVWSGLVGMLSLPRSIDLRQLSARLAGKCCLDLTHSLSVPAVVFSS